MAQRLVLGRATACSYRRLPGSVALWADRLSCSFRMLDVYVNVNQANPMTPVAGKTLNRESSGAAPAVVDQRPGCRSAGDAPHVAVLRVRGPDRADPWPGGSRTYTRRDRTRMQLILRGKRFGMTLTEIAEIIDMYDGAESSKVRQLERVVAASDRDQRRAEGTSARHRSHTGRARRRVEAVHDQAATAAGEELIRTIGGRNG